MTGKLPLPTITRTTAFLATHSAYPANMRLFRATVVTARSAGRTLIVLGQTQPET
jgi:hypothetical protein